ncbi:MAG: hypothetical protein IPG25_18945 [Proteobacteria bacterium]|nr:hypothetical protein [Pseudomonadota bacterium]
MRGDPAPGARLLTAALEAACERALVLEILQLPCRAHADPAAPTTTGATRARLVRDSDSGPGNRFQ